MDPQEKSYRENYTTYAVLITGSFIAGMLLEKKYEVTDKFINSIKKINDQIKNVGATPHCTVNNDGVALSPHHGCSRTA